MKANQTETKTERLFKTISKVQGQHEPLVDWYYGATEAEARAAWDEDFRRYSLPMDKTTVEFIECDPVTMKPISEKQ